MAGRGVTQMGTYIGVGTCSDNTVLTIHIAPFSVSIHLSQEL